MGWTLPHGGKTAGLISELRNTQWREVPQTSKESEPLGTLCTLDGSIVSLVLSSVDLCPVWALCKGDPPLGFPAYRLTERTFFELCHGKIEQVDDSLDLVNDKIVTTSGPCALHAACFNGDHVAVLLPYFGSGTSDIIRLPHTGIVETSSAIRLPHGGIVDETNDAIRLPHGGIVADKASR